jgi:broad specificity phosphatase PhoE
MSVLVLVRHGQASFLEEDYDKLSTIGQTQSRQLGEYWARRGVRFDRVISGPRVRQKHTAELVGEGFREAGLPWPDAEIVPEFDEFQFGGILESFLPQLMETNTHVRELMADYENAESMPDKKKKFQKAFEAIVDLWISGQLKSSDVESWPAFVNRVRKGIHDIVSTNGSGSRIAVFTSGGPTAVSMKVALNLADQDSIQLAWQLRNGAITEFLYSGNRFTLSSFNNVSHLDDPELWTYR